MKFYFKKANLENWQAINQELKKIFVPFVESNPELYGYNHVYYPKYIKNTLFDQWVKKHNLTPRATAVIIVGPQRLLQIHDDFVPENTSSLAINMEIMNCDETAPTYMFDPLVTPTLTENHTGLPYYSYQRDECILKCQFDLKTPVLFDTSVPHQVANYTDKKRVSISFRFVEDCSQFL